MAATKQYEKRDEKRDETKRDEPRRAANVGEVRDDDDPIAIDGKVVDNAYAELTIDGKTYSLWPEELHRLRKILDRAMIELPR